MLNKKCVGCGSVLQNEYIDKKGFVKNLDNDYCLRCYRLMHYNEMPKILAKNEEYDNILTGALKKNALVVLVVDVFDFSATFIPKIIDYLRDKNVIVVANKYDLLPKSTNVYKIVDFILKESQKQFFKILAAHVVSSKKGYFLDDLMNTIDLFRNDRDVYFVGCANVGKSSLINALLKRFSARTTDLISTSNIPGTTLDLINIPFFNDNKAFIDTPGLINEGNILNKLMPKSYSMIVPTKEIKPINYQIFEDNKLFISGLIALDIKGVKDLSVTCYFSDKLLLHRTKSKSIEEFMEKHLGEMLNPPSKEEIKNIKYVCKEYKISKEKNELYISGLGFISFNKSTTIKVLMLEGIDVVLRNGIIGRKI